MLYQTLWVHVLHTAQWCHTKTIKHVLKNIRGGESAFSEILPTYSLLFFIYFIFSDVRL